MPANQRAPARLTTEDGFLNGRLTLRQPAKGFRAGLDAVMLAAAVPARKEQSLLELGSGVGTALLCLVARVPGCQAVGVDVDEALVELANANAAANGMAAHVRFVRADVLSLPRGLNVTYDHVFCNPPFHDARGEVSPDAQRARAKQDRGMLKQWLEAGVGRTAPGGTFTVILSAERLKDGLDALPATGVRVFPLWPKAGIAARRAILQLRRGSDAPFTLLPGMVLHEADGRYTPQADAVLRGAAALDIG